MPGAPKLTIVTTTLISRNFQCPQTELKRMRDEGTEEDIKKMV